MSGSKKIHVSSSSLVDLKAELLRKKDQFRKEKLQSTAGVIKARSAPQKPNIWSQKNAGVLERAQRDLEVKAEERNDIERSRSALEVKAKLYDQMSKADKVPEEDGSKTFLVDFQRKAIDTILEKRHERLKQEEDKNREREDRRQKEEEEAEKTLLSEDIPNADDPDLEWVDYVDSLGRSRRCLKQDLPKIQAMDHTTKKERTSKELLTGDKELMSEDMRREMLREKWEKEASEALDQEDVHYANVQFDEIRSHGVGYYQFAKQEESRQEQMEALSSLRDQTRGQRQKKEEFKAKRAAKLAERLAKVKRRKLIREGRDPSDIDESELMAVPDDSSIEPAKEPELLTRDLRVSADKPIREWDEGKKAPEPMDYYEQRRSERVSEFAPPTALYDSQPKQQPTKPKAPNLSDYKTAKNVRSVDTTPVTTPPPGVSSSEGIGKVITDNLGVIRASLDGASSIEKTQNTTMEMAGKSSRQFPPWGEDSQQNTPPNSDSEQYPPWEGSSHQNRLQATGANLRVSEIAANPGMYGYPQDPHYQQYYQQYYQWWYQYGQYGPAQGATHGMGGQGVPIDYSKPPPGFDPSKPPPNLPPPPGIVDQSTLQTGQALGNIPNLNLPPPPPPPPESLSSDTPTGQATLSNPPIPSSPSPGPLPPTGPYPPPPPSSSAAYPPPPPLSSAPNPMPTPPPTASSALSLPPAQPVIKSQPVPYTQPTPEPPLDSTSVLRGAPQPAHYASAPMKVQPPKPRYHHINLHDLPPTLPAPPSAGVTPAYRSQTGAVGPRARGKLDKPVTQEQAERMWKKQFNMRPGQPSGQRDGDVSSISSGDKGSNTVTAAQPMDMNKLKPSSIPFASPYIQTLNPSDT